MDQILSSCWKALGLLIEPTPSYPDWLTRYTGASSIVAGPGEGLFWFYITGRDASNRSLIGRVLVDMRDGGTVIDIERAPCFFHGELGAFDEDGVSYPCIVPDGGVLHLFYTGWVATCSTGFQNQLGRAVSHDGGKNFFRISSAPVMHRTDNEPFSIGSTFVMQEHGKWRMWYTCFLGWHKNQDKSIGHRYLIRYAESQNGCQWRRDYLDRIGFELEEHSICHPSVLKLGNTYHLWFCARGEYYRLFHAISRDGIVWYRLPYRLPVDVGGGWDNHSQCYPSAFEYKDAVYVAYSGNDYGRGGLGILMATVESLKSVADCFWEKMYANEQ